MGIVQLKITQIAALTNFGMIQDQAVVTDAFRSKLDSNFDPMETVKVPLLLVVPHRQS